MKFVKVLEHNGEFYRVGDVVCVTFNTGIAASGTIKRLGEYCFFDEGLKDGIEFGDYIAPLDSIVEMKKMKSVSDDIMNFAVAVLAQVAEYANQENRINSEGNKLVCLDDVERAINKHLGQ